MYLPAHVTSTIQGSVTAQAPYSDRVVFALQTDAAIKGHRTMAYHLHTGCAFKTSSEQVFFT